MAYRDTIISKAIADWSKGRNCPETDLFFTIHAAGTKYAYDADSFRNVDAAAEDAIEAELDGRGYAGTLYLQAGAGAALMIDLRSHGEAIANEEQN